MNNKPFRAPAVPLITHDPMFSLWSFASELTDDTTRHWSGTRQFIIGVVSIDGVVYEFLGKLNPVNIRYFTGYRKLRQISCTIRPMSTIYCFENEQIRLELTFTSPLPLNDLELMSRPASYISYSVTAIDGAEHKVQLYFGFSGEFCVSDPDDEVFVGMDALSIYFSSGTERMLERFGDDHRIEWGSLHIIAPGCTLAAMSLRYFQLRVQRDNLSLLRPVNYCDYQGPNLEGAGPDSIPLFSRLRVSSCWPTIVASESFTLGSAPHENHLTLCYDDVKSIQYFGENLDAYWKTDGCDFSDVMRRAIAEYDAVMEKVRVFESDLLDKASALSEEYAQILALAYRQTVAGHKLCRHDGKLLFFSKECFSNGCIATVDITYPSLPLFLMYEPRLVEGMLEPVFEMCDRGLWSYEFAPHDVGRYPLANGQIYGFDFRYRKRVPDPRDSQMPVEECGNMILCVAALCAVRKNWEYFSRHRTLLTRWADYLAGIGFDPASQLCTDDFAGHLAHNCNLSVKAICALGAFAAMLEAIGETGEAKRYRLCAESFAAMWERHAFDGDHYRLAFDLPESWSIKYNLLWDRLLKLGLFPERVYGLEQAWYSSHINRYGLPLDSRADYTKSDWQIWSTALSDDKAYFDAIVGAMYAYLNDTPDRIPFSDLNFTSEPISRGFQARTVLGGLFLPLLKL